MFLLAHIKWSLGPTKIPSHFAYVWMVKIESYLLIRLPNPYSHTHHGCAWHVDTNEQVLGARVDHVQLELDMKEVSIARVHHVPPHNKDLSLMSASSPCAHQLIMSNTLFTLTYPCKLSQWSSPVAGWSRRALSKPLRKNFPINHASQAWHEPISGAISFRAKGVSGTTELGSGSDTRRPCSHTQVGMQRRCKMLRYPKFLLWRNVLLRKILCSIIDLDH
jgi:hypothetical protein